MIRRSFLALAAVVTTLSACASPLVETAANNRLQVTNVTVEVADGVRVKGREIQIGGPQIKTDVRAAVLAAFAAAPQGTRQADVQIEVTEVFLSNAAAAALGLRSKVDSIVTVTDTQTGAVILEPAEVDGLSIQDLRFGGIIGAAVTASVPPAEDYRETVSRYATTLRLRLLGDGT